MHILGVIGIYVIMPIVFISLLVVIIWGMLTDGGTKKKNKKPDLYSSIEQAIIDWEIDGTKTAGALTREILDIIRDTK